MPIVGTRFTKIDAEKKELTGVAPGPINNSADVVDVFVKDVNFAGVDKVLVFKFLFKSEYDTEDKKGKYGEIRLIGELDYLVEEPEKIAKRWKKDKKILDKALFSEVMQIALNLSHVEAMILAKDLNLPSPLPMPRVKAD